MTTSTPNTDDEEGEEEKEEEEGEAAVEEDEEEEEDDDEGGLEAGLGTAAPCLVLGSLSLSLSPQIESSSVRCVRCCCTSPNRETPDACSFFPAVPPAMFVQTPAEEGGTIPPALRSGGGDEIGEEDEEDGEAEEAEANICDADSMD
jgi:hypothetical protein